MKRTVLLVLIATLASLALAAFTFAQPTPSIPHLINLQGRATDNVGNPVSDGGHTFTFRIFNVPAAGVALWTEGPLAITTAGGLFTHQLGSSTPFPISSTGYVIFYDETQLWLEIEVDGNIISPRTQLITTPYTQVANFVESDPEPSIGIVTVRIPAPNTDCHISTYGGGSLQKTQLGNCAYGELLMWGGAAFQDVALQALGGGQLTLGDGGGINTINLYGGLLGDASVVVPTDAVNSGEMLDEPGIASKYNSSIIHALSGATIDLDSAIITVPSGGFIVIAASAIDYPSHTNGTRDVSRYSISTVSAATDFAYLAFVTTPAVVATDFDMPQSVAVHRVDAVGGPGTYRYYFTAEEFSGTCNAYQPKITAMYFPTPYGPVDVSAAKPIAAQSDNSLGYSAQASQAPLVQTVTAADHTARLEAERAKQLAELEARIKALEAQVNTDRLPERGMVGPRKER